MIDRSFHRGLEVLHTSPPARAPRQPSLVFLHGAFAGAWVWADGFLPWFARRGYPVYALSFRGHGESDELENLHDLGIEDYLEDLRTLMGRLDEPPVLIGHSMGGYVVQKALLEFDLPAYVLMASVPPTGLMGPAVTMSWCEPWLLRRLFEIQSQGGHVASPDTLREAVFWNDVPKRLAASYLARVQNESRRATLDLYWPAVLNVARLRRIPALVVGASQDRLISPMHVQQTAALVGATPHLFADMGHAMMLEPGWENVAERIHEFLTARVGSP